jgi:hypothetical protein
MRSGDAQQMLNNTIHMAIVEIDSAETHLAQRQDDTPAITYNRQDDTLTLVSMTDHFVLLTN